MNQAHSKVEVKLSEAIALADKHRRAGRVGPAREIYTQILASQPENPQSLYGLALLAMREEKYAQAIPLLNRVLAVKPQDAEAWMSLGTSLHMVRQYGQAEKAYRKTIEIKPDYIAAYTNLGAALQDQDRLDDAFGVYGQALKVDPNYAVAHNNIASIYRARGDVEKSSEHLRQAIRLDASYGDAYWNLVSSHRYSPEDREEIDRMEKVLERKDLTRNARLHVHFALGKVYDDCKQWDKAFPHYDKANELSQIRLDGPRHTAFIDALIETFTADLFREKAGLGRDDDLPVLIVGMPRSGTTLVEQILSSHPQVHGAGELKDFSQIRQQLPIAMKTAGPYPQCIRGLSGTVAQGFADQYLKHLRSLGGAAARVSDKMPMNFMHLGLIALLLPGAHIIHCRRHPLDVCLSCYFQKFNRSLPFAYHLPSLGLYYQQYDRLMRHWEQVLPAKVMTVDYEQLVEDQEAVSRKMVQFCGLEWDPQCLDFHKTKRSVKTTNVEVRQPLYKRSVDRWPHYEKFLGPLKAAMGDAAP